MSDSSAPVSARISQPLHLADPGLLDLSASVVAVVAGRRLPVLSAAVLVVAHVVVERSLSICLRIARRTCPASLHPLRVVVLRRLLAEVSASDLAGVAAGK